MSARHHSPVASPPRALRMAALLLVALYGWLSATLETRHNHGFESTAPCWVAEHDDTPCPVRLFAAAHGDLPQPDLPPEPALAVADAAPSGPRAPALADPRLPRRRGPPIA